MTLKLALVLAVLGASSSAMAASPRCDNDALMKSIGRLNGGKTLKIAKHDGEVSLELVHGTSRDTAMRVTCEAIDVPVADTVERPAKGSATRAVDGITVSRTQNGAISLEFPATLLDHDAVSMLVLDDDSVSIVRGDKVFYAFATKSDGTTVETQGIGNGCGCERTTGPDGKVFERRL